MKRLCNRFCNFMQLCATLLLLPAVALAQDVPVPEPTPPEPAAETNTVPPVLLRDIRVQTIGEERHLEELPEGLLFVDATTGKLCLADENDPHGRFVCLCRDIDWHTFTNTVKFNGHRLEFNQFWSQVAEGGSLLYRFGTNSWLRLVGSSSGDFCPFTVDAYDPTNGTMVLTADVTSSPVLQVCTNLLEADAWQTATNAAVTTTTDASTTWTITLLGTPFETYRILATVHLPAGIHAERPLHANQGIEMDGTTWTSFPDTNAFLTAETDAAALAALAAETSARTAADSALDGAVASVERRVEALEYPETCVLWWTTNLQSGGEYYIPTNFPTKRLEVRVNRTGLASCILIIDCSWSPASDVEIDIISYAESAGTNAVRMVNGHGGTVYTGNTSGTQARRWLVSFDATTGLWRSYFFTVDSQFGVVSKAVNPAGGAPFEPTGPITVEEWVAAWKARQNGTPALFLSPSPALLSPAALQPEEEPLDEPAFDASQDPETDR